MFYGSTFIFDDIPGENYNLCILDFEKTGGEGDSSAGSESKIYKTWLYRKPKPYFYGRSFETPLSFDFTVGSFDPIIGIDRSLIERWLLGRNTYLPLQICQDDISSVYFNVIFTSAKNKYIGNIHQGITLNAECDAPFGFTEEKTYSCTVDGDGSITNSTFNFDNQSDDTDYLYPSIVFQTNDIGTSVSLTNNTDEGRSFAFGGIGYDPISVNETITVNNYNQTIVSDSGLRRLSKFNKKWFRLLPGINSLTLVGGLLSFQIVYKFARKIGA